MRQFIANRFWACILACALVGCAIASAPHTANAGGSLLGFTEGGDPNSGGGNGGGTGGVTVGDPDVPTTTGKGSVLHGTLQQPSQYSATSSGARADAWIVRLRVVLQTLRMRWLGF